MALWNRDNNILSQVGINGDKCCFPGLMVFRVCNQNISVFTYNVY